MKKPMKLCLAGLVVGSCALSAHAAPIAAWDFDNSADSANGYTPFIFAETGTEMTSSTVGGLTLAQGQLWVARTHNTSISNLTSAAETDPAISTVDVQTLRVFRDGIDVTTAGQTMTLSGLDTNQEYRVQMYGHVVLSYQFSNRNIGMDVGGLASGEVFGAADAPLGGDVGGIDPAKISWAAFSEYIDFTPDASSLTLTLSESGSGDKTFSGFAIETIPEPATLGLVAAFGGGILLIRRRFMI